MSYRVTKSAKLMKLKKQTILELGKILKEEFNLTLGGKELEKFAYCLVGYFDLLLKIQSREEVQK
ncbi:MAG: hypothetical protein GYA14_04500 [Ignavibacteria bacterium]|nr:hypothetical protein [Ignavibacteria bacterium]